jgi:hypothetical protein
VLVVQDFFDVQSVFPCPVILPDPVDQYRYLWNWRIHPVEQAQFEWQRDLRKALRPIWFDPAVFDLLCARDDLRQPLAFNSWS